MSEEKKKEKGMKEMGSGLESRTDHGMKQAVRESRPDPLPRASREEEDAKRMANHFGYASDEERRRKRGLEDWELVDSIPTSQKPVPKWFIAIIVGVVFVSLSLSFPFFGRRAFSVFDWSQWSMGVIGAVVWIIAGSFFIYFMTRMYGSKTGGRLDNDTHDDSDNTE